MTRLRAVRAVAVVALVLALSGCGGGGGGGTTTGGGQATPALYRYDAGAPLGYVDKGVVLSTSPVKVHDVSFASPRGGRVLGYLTVPPGKGPYPAVIFLHGTGGSRANFVPEASWLSGRNVVGLTIDSPFVRPHATLTGVAGVRQERDLEAQAVVDVRRAVDVLRSLEKVDGDRVGLLGFSAGAKTAAIAAGVEPRLKAVVVVSGGATPVESYAATVPPRFRKQVRALLTSVDPARYIGRASGKLLVQIGRADEVVPRSDLEALAKAAHGAEVKRYDAGHELVTVAPAIRDQLDWLAQRLGAKGTVPDALTGPR